MKTIIHVNCDGKTDCPHPIVTPEQQSTSVDVQSIVKRIVTDRAAILDTFTKAYLAHLYTENPTFNFRRLTLNEQIMPDGVSRQYYFTIKPGPLPARGKTNPSKKYCALAKDPDHTPSRCPNCAYSTPSKKVARGKKTKK